MNNKRRLTRVAATLVMLCLAMGTGCSHLQEGGAADPVSGFYDGDWYGGNAEEPLGELTCTIVRRDGETWDATFSATFGGFGEYDVALEGKRQDTKVIFGGSVDLGETSGGVFEWTGEILDEQFTGNYTSRFINGTFRMLKSPSGSQAN